MRGSIRDSLKTVLREPNGQLDRVALLIIVAEILTNSTQSQPRRRECW